jgi:hypothetical protein
MNLSFEHVVIVFLAGYTLVRELFFHYTVQKLINKLMSRNYQEFKYTDGFKSVESKDRFEPPHMDGGIPEDLGSLAGIG